MSYHQRNPPSSSPTQNFRLSDFVKCSFYSFPVFTVRPHLREVLAGGHDVIHKKDIASLKIDGMENKVGELVEAVSTFHLLTVFPYPCGTETVGDFQAMRKEAAKPGDGMGISTALAAFSL